MTIPPVKNTLGGVRINEKKANIMWISLRISLMRMKIPKTIPITMKVVFAQASFCGVAVSLPGLVSLVEFCSLEDAGVACKRTDFEEVGVCAFPNGI